jgi:hypothetical protein
MVTSPAIVTRTCLAGQTAACREVLGIDRPADALTAWYTPRARRAMVEPLADLEVHTVLKRNIESAMPGAISACVTERDDAVCTRIIRTHFDSGAYMFAAQTKDTEQSFVQLAVGLPGAPGLKAVIGRENLGLRESLEAIGGRPIDQMIESWLARVIAAEPESVDPSAGEALQAMFWIVALGALALGGTRWRSV